MHDAYMCRYSDLLEFCNLLCAPQPPACDSPSGWAAMPVRGTRPCLPPGGIILVELATAPPASDRCHVLVVMSHPTKVWPLHLACCVSLAHMKQSRGAATVQRAYIGGRKEAIEAWRPPVAFSMNSACVVKPKRTKAKRSYESHRTVAQH